MTQSPFPIPDLTPLTRLHVHDNLRVNAERWALAHDYHQQRQGIHYQSFWKPGIVYGLGIKPISAPSTTADQFQDNRWLEIQPGLAIDGAGNPIVVGQHDDRTYHLALPNLNRPSQTLYLVLSYVNPDGLETSDTGDRSLEKFRFDQYVGQLKPNDIELCRITLSQQNGNFKTPQNPLAPQSNELDLRYRPPAELRSQKRFSLGYISQVPHKRIQGLTKLLASLPALYPQLQGTLERTPFNELSTAAQNRVDIVYVNAQTLIQWTQKSEKNEMFGVLKAYTQSGGNLLIEASVVSSELKQSLKNLNRELHLRKVPLTHAIGQKPFLFGAFPTLQGRPTELFYDEGVCLFVGDITDIWSGRGLSREEIRAHHEWGINILHYLWERNHFKTLLR